MPNSKGPPSSLVQLRSAVWTGDTRDTTPAADMPPHWLWSESCQKPASSISVECLLRPATDIGSHSMPGAMHNDMPCTAFCRTEFWRHQGGRLDRNAGLLFGCLAATLSLPTCDCFVSVLRLINATVSSTSTSCVLVILAVLHQPIGRFFPERSPTSAASDQRPPV